MEQPEKPSEPPPEELPAAPPEKPSESPPEELPAALLEKPSESPPEATQAEQEEALPAEQPEKKQAVMKRLELEFRIPWHCPLLQRRKCLAVRHSQLPRKCTSCQRSLLQCLLSSQDLSEPQKSFCFQQRH